MSDAKLTAAEMIREQCDNEREFLAEFREGYTHETDVPCDYDRHFESKSVAKQLDNGLWVGWTYWYGGGKHAEPEAIDWIGEAYFLDVETVMEPVLKFTQVKGKR